VLYDSPASRELAAESCFKASELCDLISTRNHPELKADAKLLLRYCARTYRESDWGKKAAEKAR